MEKNTQQILLEEIKTTLLAQLKGELEKSEEPGEKGDILEEIELIQNAQDLLAISSYVEDEEGFIFILLDAVQSAFG